MFAPRSFKFLLVFALCFSSCGWRAATTAETGARTDSAAAEQLKSGVPFATEEPEDFQAEFVITSGGAESKIFAARATGNRSRLDYDAGAANQLTVLQTSGERFLILPTAKIYAETSAAQSAAPPSENAADFLRGALLNQTADAKFTKLGAENDLTKYAVRLDEAENAEAFVYVDEQINLPVREELYSVKGEQRILTYAVEMKNFKAQADANLFDAPKDFRKVSVEALRGARRAMKRDGE